MSTEAMMIKRFRTSFSRSLVVATISKAKTFLKTKALLNAKAYLSMMSVEIGMESFSFCLSIPLAITIGRPIPIAWGVMTMAITSTITLGMMAIVMESLRISICISFSRPLAITIAGPITSPIALGVMSMVMECLRISLSISLVVA